MPDDEAIYLTAFCKVIFKGNISFGYSEWEGSLFSVSGTNITVQGATGSFLDGQGALYWDGMFILLPIKKSFKVVVET